MGLTFAIGAGFLPPPIEPCMRFSRTRLTDVLHRRHSASPSPQPVGPRRDDGSVEADQPEAVRPGEAQTALHRGTLRAPSRTTLTEAAADWLSAAEAGVVRTRSGDPYKPSALRAYEQALLQKLLPVLGPLLERGR